MAAADLRFWFDPVCPFAWLTGRWVRQVAARRAYRVEWRFVSLRLLNASVDYAAQFPPEYEAGHTDGLHLLRLAARVRDEHGPEAVDALYLALGERIHDVPPDRAPAPGEGRTAAFARPALATAGLPAHLAAALDDDGWDAVVQAETDEALRLAGRDVGTPILQFRPPDGPAFFGPVISRVPDGDDALALWDHVVALAGFPGFAELKRSLRERPQLAAAGVAPDEVGREEDWHGGSRRQHR
ncbi:MULTISPECIES: mycothiol-dependent nitroreductase Rv2466c family protein [unclassified Blastococcus]